MLGPGLVTSHSVPGPAAPRCASQALLRREVASWKANLEVVLVCRGFLRSSGGQQPSIVQDTTEVSPLIQQNRHPLARLLHLTTTYLNYSTYEWVHRLHRLQLQISSSPARAPSEYLVND